VPVIGCGAGPSCHGHIVVLQDILGMTDWQPPFAKPMTNLGQQIEQTAAKWVQRVETGEYLRDGGPYTID
jgi:3-methyl-2-oxobutanoate hydroxymethyltransferase